MLSWEASFKFQELKMWKRIFRARLPSNPNSWRCEQVTKGSLGYLSSMYFNTRGGGWSFPGNSGPRVLKMSVGGVGPPLRRVQLLPGPVWSYLSQSDGIWIYLILYWSYLTLSYYLFPCCHAMNVCMSACMHVCMYVCIFVCNMFVCIYVCMYVCMYVCNMYAICMYVCMHACTYLGMYVCMCVCVSVCMYVYVPMCPCPHAPVYRCMYVV